MVGTSDLQILTRAGQQVGRRDGFDTAIQMAKPASARDMFTNEGRAAGAGQDDAHIRRASSGERNSASSVARLSRIACVPISVRGCCAISRAVQSAPALSSQASIELQMTHLQPARLFAGCKYC